MILSVIECKFEIAFNERLTLFPHFYCYYVPSEGKKRKLEHFDLFSFALNNISYTFFITPAYYVEVSCYYCTDGCYNL